MKNKESGLPEDWFELADRDLNRVQIMLNEEDFADAGVHLQQALEKYLKGYLLSKGWELQRTHNLVKLLDYAVEKNKSFEEGWRNKLIWGDNKLVMASLLEKFAVKINLIYIDPPFATGADFKFSAHVR